MAHQIFNASRPFPLMHLARRPQTRVLMQTLAPVSQTLIPGPSYTAGSLRSKVLDLISTSRTRFATHRDGRSDSFAYRLRASGHRMPPPRPPRRRSGFSQWLDNNVPDNALIWGMVGLNVLVFIGWKMAVAADVCLLLMLLICVILELIRESVGYGPEIEKDTDDDEELHGQLDEHDTPPVCCRVFSPRQPLILYRWSLVTSFFSHMDFWHLGFNMFTFYFLAPPVLQILGPAKFLTLYFGAGLASNIASAISNRLFAKRDTPSLGASGTWRCPCSFEAVADVQ